MLCAINKIRYMRTIFSFLIMLILIASCNQMKESKTNKVNSKIDTLRTKLNYLSYANEKKPENILWTVGFRREVYSDGSFCLLNYDLKDSINYNYKTCFDEFGYPLGNGTSDKFESVYKDKMELNFRGRDTIIYMDTKKLINPMELWFWKTKPNEMDSVLVNRVMKNFITNSIDIRSSYFKYMGYENIVVSNNEYNAHKVKTWTIGQPKNVYDERWYNDEGILVKELHFVGEDGTRIGLLKNIKE